MTDAQFDLANLTDTEVADAYERAVATAEALLPHTDDPADFVLAHERAHITLTEMRHRATGRAQALTDVGLMTDLFTTQSTYIALPDNAPIGMATATRLRAEAAHAEVQRRQAEAKRPTRRSDWNIALDAEINADLTRARTAPGPMDDVLADLDAAIRDGRIAAHNLDT